MASGTTTSLTTICSTDTVDNPAATPPCITTTALNKSDNPDCAICLDSIRPSHHAKATLACRHEFHLSCIS
ncbi:hypothetical protein BX616_008469, partial [Lobosporangium transversale]